MNLDFMTICILVFLGTGILLFAIWVLLPKPKVKQGEVEGYVVKHAIRPTLLFFSFLLFTTGIFFLGGYIEVVDKPLPGQPITSTEIEDGAYPIKAMWFDDTYVYVVIEEPTPRETTTATTVPSTKTAMPITKKITYRQFDRKFFDGEISKEANFLVTKKYEYTGLNGVFYVQRLKLLLQ